MTERRVGLEQEFFLVDEAGAPSDRADEFLWRCRKMPEGAGLDPEGLAGECGRGMVEINTPSASSVKELVEAYLEEAAKGFEQVSGCKDLIVVEAPDGAGVPDGMQSFDGLLAENPAEFDMVQDLLAQMLGNVTASQCMILRLSQMQDGGVMKNEHASLAKAFRAHKTIETVRLARELLTGNGILTDYSVARFLADAEAIYSYEDTCQANRSSWAVP